MSLTLKTENGEATAFSDYTSAHHDAPPYAHILDRHAEIRTDTRQTRGHTDTRHTDSRRYGQTLDRQTREETDRQTRGRTDKQTLGYMNSHEHTDE